MPKITKLISLAMLLLLNACQPISEPSILEVKTVEIVGTTPQKIELMLINKDNVCLLKTKIISNLSTTIEKDWAFINGQLILISENPTLEVASDTNSPDAKIEEQIRQVKQNKEANQLKSLIAPEHLKKCQS